MIHPTAATPPGQPIADHDGAPWLHREAGVWRITLNRPAQHNRLDPADVTALHAVFDDARTTALSALVIAGAGARTFSSGYTLSAIIGELDDRFEAMLDTLEKLPFVTVAALNGSVYGGATDLALCCDIRLGTEGMKMFMPAARFGLHYYPGGLRRYVSRLGLSAASKLMLTGMTIEGAEMLRIGFLNELVSADALSDRVENHVDACLQTEPGVVAAMKTQLHALAAQLHESQIAGLEKSMLDSHRLSLRSEALKDRVENASRS